jgi:hypothetical protein
MSRILVIDDDGTILELLEATLRPPDPRGDPQALQPLELIGRVEALLAAPTTRRS